MERGRINRPDLILCGDLHLREDTPICRTDSYMERQWIKMDFIKDLQKQYSIPVIMSGDLYHTWKTSPYLLSETMKHLPEQFYGIIGNHDAPSHNIQLINKSGINVLREAGRLTMLDGTHFGQTPQQESLIIKGRKILVWHKMVWQKEKPYPTCTDDPASTVIRNYNYDLLLFGDNHKTFVEEYEGRLLVNPGSMMRMTADQVDHKPCVFLWYAESNTVQQVFLPIEEGVISRQHLDVKEERNERIDAFISKLSGDYKTELSFEANLESFFQANEVKESVKQIIYKSIE